MLPQNYDTLLVKRTTTQNDVPPLDTKIIRTKNSPMKKNEKANNDDNNGIINPFIF